MLKEKSYTLKSVCPMLMHNGQTADPTNAFAKAMKIISGKRAKTEADHEELARLEFLAGLYMAKGGPCIPPQNLRGMLIYAARKRKEGKLAEAGVFVTDNMLLEYDGPRDPDELWKDGRFTDRRLVVVNRARIARTRPVFDEWQGVAKVLYDDDVLSEHQLDEWMVIAGSIIGLGDYRPQYGRFEAV